MCISEVPHSVGRRCSGYGLWWAHGTIFWWRPRFRQGKVQFLEGPVNTTTSGRRQYDVRHVAVIDVGTTSYRRRLLIGPAAGRCGATSANDVGPTSERDVAFRRRPDVVVFTGPSKNCTFPWQNLGRHQKMVPWAHKSPYPKHLRPTLCGTSDMRI